MKYTKIIVIMAFAYVGCQRQPVEPFSIIPHPANIEYVSGSITLKSEPVIAFSEELTNEAQFLQSYLSSDFSVRANLKEGKGKADIVLQIDPTVLPEKKEGYVLEALSRSIVVKANSPEGIFNGIQTLRQALKGKDGKLMIQKATVTDYPAFSWRAFMLDEARYFKGKEVVFTLLDEMARLKMNIFHWHLTDDQGWRIEIKKYPKLTEIGAWRDSSEINHFHSNIYDGVPHGGFYTQEQIGEIVEYAAKRHITIVPEFNMPGHASAAIASYPWLGTSGKKIKVSCKFGVHYDIFNVADPRVMQFFEDVIDELIALFPSPVIHIGGDELRYNHWLESPVIQKYMKDNHLKSPAELQVFFTNNISNLFVLKNRRMMGWNDITGDRLHTYQTAIDTVKQNRQLAPGTVVHFWKGDPVLLLQTIEKGFDVVNSYHVYTYLDYTLESISLEKAYGFNPVPEGLTEEQSKRVLGLGCQMWGEFIPTVESMNLKIFPRIAAYAETGWTDISNKDYDRFLKALEFLNMSLYN